MERARYAALAGAVLALAVLTPAGARQDAGSAAFLRAFVPEEFTDVDGDGIPDLADLEEGSPGLWADLVGARTRDDFLVRIDPDTRAFDLDTAASALTGPCGGLAISWDAKGMSIDAAIDLGDGEPPIDAVTGGQAFTAGNPFRVDPAGTIGYFGFSGDAPGLSAGEAGRAFHDHRWEIRVMGISTDAGGSPNLLDENRVAGIVDLTDLLPLEFRAKVKVRGVIVDRWGPGPLPDVDGDSIAAIAAGREYCAADGWVELAGGGFPLLSIPGVLATALVVAGFGGLLLGARPDRRE
jgi:hypothetical protein